MKGTSHQLARNPGAEAHLRLFLAQELAAGKKPSAAAENAARKIRARFTDMTFSRVAAINYLNTHRELVEQFITALRPYAHTHELANACPNCGAEIFIIMHPDGTTTIVARAQAA